MKARTFVVCLLAVAIVAPAAVAESNPVKPGKWQMTMQMDMPGMPFKMPPVTMTHCITEEDVKTAIPQDQKIRVIIDEWKADYDSRTVDYFIDTDYESGRSYEHLHEFTRGSEEWQEAMDHQHTEWDWFDHYTGGKDAAAVGADIQKPWDAIN